MVVTSLRCAVCGAGLDAECLVRVGARVPASLEPLADDVVKVVQRLESKGGILFRIKGRKGTVGNARVNF
jgi:hypothetical protein